MNHTAKLSWSTYQQAIYANFEDNDGHAVVEAVAGSGKTTTIIEGTNHVPRHQRVLLCAFNKSIQTELARRVHGTIDVRTLHSLGLLACKRAFGDVTIDENKGRDLARRVCIEHGHFFIGKQDGAQVPKAGWQKVAKLAGIAKNTLTNEDDQAAMENLATDFRLDDDPRSITGEQLALWAAECIKLAADDKVALDFDDMVWFPARHELRPASHDVVVVDERQDLNAAQVYLTKALCRREGRIVAVGDRYQAIYGFRGADSRAMDQMVQDLGAITLPLSISYRCPKSVVRLAQEVVPHFEAASDAPEGLVRHCTAADLKGAQPGEMILSRTKAPLLRHALGFLARGTPACILGRDIAKSIVKLIERSKRDDVPSMNRWIEDWRQKEVFRLRELERDELAEEVNDTAEVVFTLSEGEQKTQDVIARTHSLFRDDDPQTRVVLSTVHKAKGLERDKVWMIADTFKLWEGDRWQEERNLYYVAVTRAKSELCFVGEVRR